MFGSEIIITGDFGQVKNNFKYSVYGRNSDPDTLFEKNTTKGRIR